MYETIYNDSEGREMLNNIPIANKERDAAWKAFIKRKDVKAFFKDKDDTFKFPLERGWYELWCQCWEMAWEAGCRDGKKNT